MNSNFFGLMSLMLGAALCSLSQFSHSEAGSEVPPIQIVNASVVIDFSSVNWAGIDDALQTDSCAKKTCTSKKVKVARIDGQASIAEDDGINASIASPSSVNVLFDASSAAAKACVKSALKIMKANAGKALVLKGYGFVTPIADGPHPPGEGTAALLNQALASVSGVGAPPISVTPLTNVVFLNSLSACEIQSRKALPRPVPL